RASARGRGRRARGRRRGPIGRVALRGGSGVPPARGDRAPPLAPRRAGTGDPPTAVRARSRGAPHPRGGGRALQPHTGAHSPDRGEGHVEAAPPVLGHRSSSPPDRLTGPSPADRG